MGLNSLVPQSHLIDMRAVLSMLSDSLDAWRNASTQEERLQVEAEVVAALTKVLDLEVEYDKVRQGSHPEQSELADFYVEYNYFLRSNLIKLQSLISLFTLYFNTQQLTLQQLLGRLKRIKQKQSALDLEQGSIDAVFAERFLNYDRLDESTDCFVDTRQGLLTLPRESVRDLTVKRVYVDSSSNGIPGHSGEEVEYTADVSVLLSADSGEFDYERLDTGPCQLNLVFQLADQSIINHVAIHPSLLQENNRFRVEDILFTPDGMPTVSVKSLVEQDLTDEFWSVGLDTDTSWSVTHLPVAARTITLKLSSTDKSTILVKGLRRNRYGIAIKQVSLRSISYKKTGIAQSKGIAVKPDLYAGIGFLDVYPTLPMFDASLEISTDGGESWQADRDEDVRVGSTFLIEENREFMWKLSLERLSDEFRNFSGWTGEGGALDFSYLLRSGSPEFSPVDMKLPDTVKSSTVFALQPGLLRVGDQKQKMSLGKEESIQVELPVDLVAAGRQDSLRVYVNGKPQEFTTSAPTTGEYSFTDDYSAVVLSDAVKMGSLVSMSLEKERLNFKLTEDGYRAETAFILDPDKKSILVEYTSANATTQNEVLKGSARNLRLKMRHISEIEVREEGGAPLTEVAQITDLVPGSYWVDRRTGTLRLGDPPGEKQLKVSYRAALMHDIRPENFSVALVNGAPKGILISKDAFVTEDVSETLQTSLHSVFSPSGGVFRTRPGMGFPSVGTPLGSKKQLSHEGIVEGSVRLSNDAFNGPTPVEVAFMDGRSEFLGLIQSKGEYVPELQFDANGIASFELAARTLYHSPLGVFFTDSNSFANQLATAGAVEIGANGDYSVSPEGVVTVKGNALSVLPKSALSYYYTDPTASPMGKFSVDYENGIVYGGSSFKATARIFYKVANYVVSYSVSKLLDSDYNAAENLLEVHTQKMSDVNTQIKCYWVTGDTGQTLQPVENYFSPLINFIGFRAS